MTRANRLMAPSHDRNVPDSVKPYSPVVEIPKMGANNPPTNAAPVTLTPRSSREKLSRSLRRIRVDNQPTSTDTIDSVMMCIRDCSQARRWRSFK